jgi:hypothetical protein
MLALSLALTLTLGPVASGYDDAAAALELARDAGSSDDHARAIQQLEQAIGEITAFPEQLADDPHAQTVLEDARMRLVWQHLANNDRSSAEAAMDDALRTTNGALSEPRAYGPAVAKLYARRRAWLEAHGRARVEVECRVPCRVIIDARATDDPIQPLYLGPHRVWIGATDSSVPPASHELDLTAAGASLSFGPPLEGPADDDGGDAGSEPTPDAKPIMARPPTTSAQPYRWLLPSWTSGLGVAAGATMIGVAAVLLAFDGKCRGAPDGPVSGPDACPMIHANKPLGVPLLAVGGAALVGFGVVLGVDLVRRHEHDGRHAMVTWTLKF